MERRQTRLQRFIEELGLKVLEIVGEANRIAAQEGVESISRQHFLSLRKGHVTATAERFTSSWPPFAR